MRRGPGTSVGRAPRASRNKTPGVVLPPRQFGGTLAGKEALVQRVRTVEEFDALRSGGVGVVFNDFSPTGSQPKLNVLHHARCVWVARMNLGVTKWTDDDESAARTWLIRERGPEGERWHACSACLSSAGLDTARTPAFRSCWAPGAGFGVGSGLDAGSGFGGTLKCVCTTCGD